MYALAQEEEDEVSDEECDLHAFAESLREQWQENLVGFLRAANLLAMAKERLPTLFWKLVDEHCPFGRRMAYILLDIAAYKRFHTADLDLDDPRHVKRISVLPTPVGTLWELTHLSPAAFEQAVRRGDIHPGIRRKDAKRLVRGVQQGERIARAAKQNVGTDVSLWVADPPWAVSYSVPYETMLTKDICELRLGGDGRASRNLKDPTVAEASAQCAAIGLWAVEELLFDAELVLASWGFEMLRPKIIWNKESHARAGSAALMQHEYLLIGVRGGAFVLDGCKPPSVVSAPRAGLANSEKPARFHTMLEEMFPLLRNRVELFARRSPPEGWRGWGNQNPGARKLRAA
jgi:N6-adenosine-specific RNA methylase IME4